MSNHWDEFSKSLAEPLPRRESLRRLGIVLAGAVLSPPASAFAAHQDPCKAFCRCRNRKQQNQCLTACKACNKDTSRLCGSCGSYVCCGSGRTCCGGYCTDLADDVLNCGACGFVCDPPGPYEFGACIDGECTYACADGTVDCNGTCTFLDWDPLNCGACDNVCPDSAPYCNQGECTGCPPGTALCGGECVDLLSDPNNCGACGNVCDESTVCSQGVCNPCGFPFILCGGACIDPASDRDNCGGCGQACLEGEVCSGGLCCNPDCTPDNPSYPNCGTVCGDPCLTFWTGLTWCDPACVDLSSDAFNCGACYHQCAPSEVCAGGFCQGFGGDGG
jgi:hypothetical protein